MTSNERLWYIDANPKPAAADLLTTPALTQAPFQTAAEAWLESRRPYISSRTFKDYKLYIKSLSAHFGEMRLHEISSDQIRAYQRMRMSAAIWASINKETSVLQQMLKRIGRWSELAHDFQSIPEPKNSDDVGRCISDEEEARFFRVGLSNPAWSVAAWASMISVNTTAGPGEILHLHLSNVDVVNRMTIRVTPEGAKNRNGHACCL
jgi:integrase